MRLLGAFLLAAAFLSPFAAQAGPAEDVAQARELLDSWRGEPAPLRRAQELLDAVLKQDPRNVHAMKEQARLVVMSGYMYSRKRRYASGRSYVLGEYAPGTLERAEGLLINATRLRPDFAEGYVLLGHIYVEKDFPKEAEKVLLKAESLGSTDPWLHLNWAALHAVRGEKDAMLARVKRVIDGGTTNSKALGAAYDYLVDNLHEQGRHEEALALARKELKREPTAWGYGSLAWNLQQLGRHEEAITAARTALKMMDHGAGRATLARSLYGRWAQLVAQGKRAPSKALFDEAYAIEPRLEVIMVWAAARATEQDLIRALAAEKKVSVEVRGSDGSTPLLNAAHKNNPAGVKLLLGMGADPNAVDSRGWTPLLTAADEGNEAIVKLLLAAGADRSAQRRGKTADQLAEARGFASVAKAIREHSPKK